MDQVMTSPLNISVGGKLWWEGLTAEFTITNTSNETLEAWSYSFTTPHKITGVPWGVSTSTESLTNGQTKYTLTGIDWAQSISAGGSVTVGFNAQQGRALGSEGTLTAELLMTTTSRTATTVESSIPIVDSTAVETQGNEQSENDSADDNHMTMDHSDHEHMEMAQTSGDYIDITSWGSFHGSNNNSEHHELMGSRTAITTEAQEAYNGLRMFTGREAVDIDAVGNGHLRMV